MTTQHNAWVYGIASGLRYNLIFTGVAILGYLALRDKPRFHMSGICALVLLFFVWTTISTLLTIGSPDTAW